MTQKQFQKGFIDLVKKYDLTLIVDSYSQRISYSMKTIFGDLEVTCLDKWIAMRFKVVEDNVFSNKFAQFRKDNSISHNYKWNIHKTVDEDCFIELERRLSNIKCVNEKHIN